jgi:hypothetical protein
LTPKAITLFCLFCVMLCTPGRAQEFPSWWGLSAISELEQLGGAARPAVLQIEEALGSDYEFIRGVARRIREKLCN